MSVLIAYIALSVFPAALVVAAANDIYEFKIPNWVSIILIAGYPVAGLAAGAPAGVIVEGFAVGAAALAVGFSLFAFNIVGGGDAKLLAATAPWMGVSAIAGFLFYTAIAGLALIVVLMTFRSLPVLPVYARAPWILKLHDRKKDLPYGVAIAAGGLISFSQTPFFQLVFGG
ncbi:MAG: hypothetical protein HKN14_02410 [Marinicaulis sp.]|nr:prepilin peptidase [Marinicaulis sp.]NNE39752.1 hypothetical protein [Marinicaulis sp.]